MLGEKEQNEKIIEMLQMTLQKQVREHSKVKTITEKENAIKVKS